MKQCPLCAEQIQNEAIKCRFCGAVEAPVRGSGAWVASPEVPISGMAVGSLVMGILWIYWMGSVLALILGYLAKREIAREHGKLAGQGLARAGIILGWVGMGTFAVMIALVAGSLLGFYELD